MIQYPVDGKYKYIDNEGNELYRITEGYCIINADIITNRNKSTAIVILRSNEWINEFMTNSLIFRKK